MSIVIHFSQQSANTINLDFFKSENYIEILKQFQYRLTNPTHHVIRFPEVNNGLPRTPQEILETLPPIVSKEIYSDFSILTTSEHLILFFQKMVRDNFIRPNDLILIEHSVNSFGRLKTFRRVVDHNGDFVDDYGAFFKDRLPLLR
jgi:hypothetical protein